MTATSNVISHLSPGSLRKVHHFALNVKDLTASRYFYGQILGLQELTGNEVPSTLKNLVSQGKIANFITPDGIILDLFWEPDLSPPDSDPKRQFTRANHLAFDIAPELFEQAIADFCEFPYAENCLPMAIEFEF